MERQKWELILHQTLRPGDLLRLMQDLAASDARRRGAGKLELLKKNCAWVLIRYRLTIARWPKAGERLRLTTWPMRSRHLFYPRCFTLTDAAGETLVEVQSLWAIIDVESRAMLSLESRGLAMEDVEEGSFSSPPRLRVPERGKTVSLTPRPEQIDENGHMNNAAYLDTAMELLPGGFSEREVSEIAIDYEHELLAGRSAQVRIVPEEDACSFEGSMEDKTCFRLRLSFR